MTAPVYNFTPPPPTIRIRVLNNIRIRKTPNLTTAGRDNNLFVPHDTRKIIRENRCRGSRRQERIYTIRHGYRGIAGARTCIRTSRKFNPPPPPPTHTLSCLSANGVVSKPSINRITRPIRLSGRSHLFPYGFAHL